jgi:hypothetical protein
LNTTIAGNSTLGDLSEGSHSITIYAKDEFGNIGKSNVVFFTVDLPDPTPSLLPSPSPTLEPTLEPTQTNTPAPSAENNQTQDFTLPIILAAVIVVTVALAALVYFRRRRL